MSFRQMEDAIIRFDISSLPDGLEIEKWYEIIIEEGIILYDSSKGETPVFMNFKGKKLKIKDYETWQSSKKGNT